MGQNNDVAWTFTNVMADVMDLFIERIDGDDYEFEGERRPLEVIEEEIGVKGRAEPGARSSFRETHHGPIVNEALRADDAEPLALRFSALDFRRDHAGELRGARLRERPRAGRWACAITPIRSRTWSGPTATDRSATRRSAGSRCATAAARICRSPAGRASTSGTGWIPYEELPAGRRPRARLPRHGQQPGRARRLPAPHHERLPRRLPRAADRGADPGARPEHDLESFEAMQTDMHSIPGLETVHRLVRLRPRDQRELSAHRAPALLGRRGWRPDSDRRDDLPGVHAAARQGGGARGDRRPRSGGALARPRGQRIRRPRDLAVALAVAPARALGGGRRRPRRAPVGRPGPRCAARRDGRPGDRVRPRSGRPGGGAACIRWSSRTPSAPPTPSSPGSSTAGWRSAAAQETVAQVGWDPNDPFKAIWAPCWRMVADPPAPSARAGRRSPGQSGHPASPHYDDLQADWMEGRTQPMAGEGPWRNPDARARMSRRARSSSPPRSSAS